MENEFIINKISETFTVSVLSIDETSDVLTIVVEKNCITDLMIFLKNELDFNFLTDLCGVHYPNQELQLGVVYHLHNMAQNKRIRIKTFTSVKSPEIKTITEIFASANWMERETYDFYGVIFEGHPKLIRILNVEYMDYFPMRKEYPLEDSTRTDKDDRFFGR
ncbi:MAG: NADH-quinone oxidoreductase subunit C [Bacteroidetes bacterium]|nr:NADH-quinone oxidoreductase subunit C [Bacteroidota bacterium]